MTWWKNDFAWSVDLRLMPICSGLHWLVVKENVAISTAAVAVAANAVAAVAA